MSFQESVLEIAHKGMQISYESVLSAIKEALALSKSLGTQLGGRTASRDPLARGEQSLKALNKHNRPLEMVSIPGGDLRTFRRELTRHGVDFAIMKDKTNGAHSLFFKGQDIPRVLSALETTIGKAAVNTAQQERGTSPPMKDVMAAAKDRAAAINQSRSAIAPAKTIAKAPAL